MAPTVKRGIVTTSTDQTNIKIDISEAIDQLTPEETPLISVVGKSSLKFPCEQIKHEWMTDELRPRAGTLGAAYVSGSGTMQLATGEGAYLVPDDTIYVEDQAYRVEAGPPSSDVLTVTLIRGTGAAGTTDAAHIAGTVWTKLAHAAQEAGVARTDASKTVVNTAYNYTQIIKDWCVVSGTMEVIKRYGYVSERAYQEAKVMRQLMLDYEYNLIYGVRSLVETPKRKSTCGGLREYIYYPGIQDSWTNVVNAGGADLTEDALNDLLEAIWVLGGTPDTIMVNGHNKRRITGWATPRIRTAQDERIAGGSIDTYESDFGTLGVRLNRNLRGSDLLILTLDEIGVGPLTGRQLTSRMLPSTLDGTWYEVLGEYTMEVHKPTLAHGWLYNTATA